MITLAKYTRACTGYGLLIVHGKITAQTSGYLTIKVDKVTGAQTGTDLTPTSGLTGRNLSFSRKDSVRYARV